MASQSRGFSEIAERYSAALFELADEAKQVDAVEADLRGLKSLLGESDDLRRLTHSPVISREQQSKAVAAILEAGKANPITTKFLGVIAANRRLFALNPIIDRFLADLAERRGELTADVTSAVKLSDEQLSALTDTLKKTFGAKVSINPTVDPAILGGLIVKVGSKLVDDSIRSKLQRLQLAMKGVG
ncbi:MAG: F0F1 ATP synthase subunit delta [Alphaproteobacteria bacterium]|nr:F0F1 ATP synthase subunit delta [Alphaproteobacteria bacterium SS10]